MKHSISIFSLLALAGSASAAVVTNGFVQNKAGQNWSHFGKPGYFGVPVGVAASQSSTGSGGVAARGIDGNYNGSWGGGSVTHTTNSDGLGTYWQVDLGAQRPISDITLFNRTDCCGGRLSNYSVLASNDAAFASTVYDSGNQSATAPASINFDNVNATAQYVRVQRTATPSNHGDNVISLAEVDVIGAYKNLATGSAPSQSSDYSASSAADSAIDGNLNNSFGSGSTTHTLVSNGGNPVFWETVLEVKSNINEISLYNRGDCCPERLSNFRVSVFDGGTEVWGQNYFEGSGNAGAIFSIQEDTGGFFATGDRVRVELIDGHNNANGGTNQVLSLREVEIYGVPEPSAIFPLIALAGLGLLRRRTR